MVWSITQRECLPGGKLFGVVILFLCAVCGGNLVGMIKLPTLPPFPPLLGMFHKLHWKTQWKHHFRTNVLNCVYVCVTGMLLAGLVLRNVPYVTDAVYIDQTWSAALRNIALAIILTCAGLGLDPTVLQI